MGDVAAVLAECRQAQAEDREISDGCARTIAAMYHSDTIGAEFSTAGVIAANPSDTWRALFGGMYATMSPDDKLMADMLGTYLITAGPRGPVPGWSWVWVR